MIGNLNSNCHRPISCDEVRCGAGRNFAVYSIGWIAGRRRVPQRKSVLLRVLRPRCNNNKAQLKQVCCDRFQPSSIARLGNDLNDLGND